MSPSRIPRPGAPPSPLGPHAEIYRGTSASPKSSPNTNYGSPTNSPMTFRPNPTFIQPRSAGLSPPTAHSSRVPANRSKRPKPPAEDDTSHSPHHSPSTPSTPGNVRRMQGGGMNSPDQNNSGIPRPARTGQQIMLGAYHQGGPRTFLRQPSTPALSAHYREREAMPLKGRNRATSAAADTRGVPPSFQQSPPLPNPSHSPAAQRPIGPSSPPDPNGQSAVPGGLTPSGSASVLVDMPLFAPSFAESREPSVPPHIRIRLRLIHQLGVVLGIDAQGISSKIDVPGLLARVDAAYDRGYQGPRIERGLSSSSMTSRGSFSSISGLPLPMASKRDSPAALGNDAVRGDGKSGKDAKVRDDRGDKSDKEKGMFGMFKRFGKDKPREEERVPLTFASPSSEGPAFGVSLNDAPHGSWCTSLIGGQSHELPLIVFTIVEEIYRRGMSQPGIFRLAGDGTRISHLTKVFNLPPLYGDSLSITSEPIHNLTGLVKRYIRDLPDPILDESLFPAFLSFCAEPEPGALILPLSTRITAAQILLKLLPPLHFSLLVYLLAFLGQLPLFPDNRLNVESISIIFGPAICAARGKGISGLGMGSTAGGKGPQDPDEISNLVNQSQSTLAWLLRNWAAISEKVLEPALDEDGGIGEGEGKAIPVDPRLLSPIDLRAVSSSTAAASKTEAISAFTRPRSQTTSVAHTNTKSVVQSARKSEDEGNSQAALPRSHSISPSPSSGSGIFARAFSSMNIAAEARRDDNEAKEKVPKRSASFTSLSSLVRKGGAFIRTSDKEKDRDREREPKSHGMTTSTSSSSKHSRDSKSSSYSTDRPHVNPQITNVLGSLHDLLVSKDKQIERDARELALLRHTLLEMDEKLQRLTSPYTPSSAPGLSPCRCFPSPHTFPPSDPQTPGSPSSHTHADNVPPTPAITITSTPSTTTLLAKDKEITDIHTQLTTALAALETARLQSRKQADKALELEAKLARADSEKRLEMGKLEVALALEQARVGGLIDERDVARDRLEKVRTTLFSVS